MIIWILYKKRQTALAVTDAWIDFSQIFLVLTDLLVAIRISSLSTNSFNLFFNSSFVDWFFFAILKFLTFHFMVSTTFLIIACFSRVNIYLLLIYILIDFIYNSRLCLVKCV